MAHDHEEVTNPGRGHQAADFEDETEGTEEVTQVDSQNDRLNSDHLPDTLAPLDPDLAPLDDDTLIPE